MIKTNKALEHNARHETDLDTIPGFVKELTDLSVMVVEELQMVK